MTHPDRATTRSLADRAAKRTGHQVVWFAELPRAPRPDPDGAQLRLATDSVRIWSCCHCDKSGPWADGWRYFGSTNSDEEGFAECVTCPACSKAKHHRQGPGPGPTKAELPPTLDDDLFGL